jgi:hypothetical protein
VPTLEPTDIDAPTLSPVAQLENFAFESYCQEVLAIDSEVVGTPFIQDNWMGGDLWELTPSQSTVFKAAFDHLDTDGSDTLNYDELLVDFSQVEVDKVLASCDHREMNFGVFTLWRQGGFTYPKLSDSDVTHPGGGSSYSAAGGSNYWQDDDMRGIFIDPAAAANP